MVESARYQPLCYPESASPEHFRDLQIRLERIRNPHGICNFATYVLLDALREWGAIPERSDCRDLWVRGAPELSPLVSVDVQGINKSLWLPGLLAYAKQLAETPALEVIVVFNVSRGGGDRPLTKSLERNLLEGGFFVDNLDSVGFRPKPSE